MLTLEQLNRLHPRNVDLRRRLAAFYERMGQLEAITVWKEAVEMAPSNVEGQFGLARAALRFGDRQTARTVLAAVAIEAKGTAEYHRLQAGLAFLEKDLLRQEEHLSVLVRMEPGDQRVRLNLATLQVNDPAGAKAAAGRLTLLELARGDQVRIRAVVELLSDVARRWPGPAPERDRALKDLADTLAVARGPLLELPSDVDHIDRLIGYAMGQPAPTAEDAVSLANWMSLNGHTDAALQWLESLPDSVSRSPVVLTAVTEFSIRGKDWVRLRKLLREGAWGPMPAGAVEQAFRAHGEAGQGSQTTAGAAWSAALEAAKPSPPALRMLLRLAELWQWPGEYRQVLQTIARNLPRENWAWRQLISHALAQGSADQLWQVYQEWRRAVPGDAMVQTEMAIMGFLLERRPVPTVGETAEHRQRQPGNAGVAVAHALALWRGQRAGEAVAVLDALPREAFAEPRYALAYGLVLAEVGRKRDSGPMLDHAARAPLLPEELRLLEGARGGSRVP